MNTGEVITFEAKKNFTFQKTLGRGGTGDTHLFKDETTNILFAIKKYVPKDLVRIDEYYERFVDEIKILFNISHPNIVRIYNYYLYPDCKTGYLQMEYINGVCINEYEPMPWNKKDWEDIFYEVINAFEYLENNNILHRDVRASNILIDQNENVKIIDFGFGKQFNGDKNSENSVLLNWPVTEMPEEIQFNQEYDEKTEIYFVGVLFKHVLRDRIKDFRFGHIIEKMTKVNPEQRYSSFSNILTDINQGVLSEISFTDEQKEWYRDFADALCNHISCYIDKGEFVSDIEQTVSMLSGVIRNSSLEEYLQDNSKLIECFVVGKYKYYSRKDIPIKVLKNFYTLITGLPYAKKKLVFANVNMRLATIVVEDSDIDIPF